MVRISSEQPRSTLAMSILDTGGSSGNSAIFRPSLVSIPSSSRAPRLYSCSRAETRVAGGGGSMKSKPCSPHMSHGHMMTAARQASCSANIDVRLKPDSCASLHQSTSHQMMVTASGVRNFHNLAETMFLVSAAWLFAKWLRGESKWCCFMHAWTSHQEIIDAHSLHCQDRHAQICPLDFWHTQLQHLVLVGRLSVEAVGLARACASCPPGSLLCRCLQPSVARSTGTPSHAPGGFISSCRLPTASLSLALLRSVRLQRSRLRRSCLADSCMQL